MILRCPASVNSSNFVRRLALACAVVAGSTSAAWAQFPLTETFQGTTAPGWILGGTAKLTAASGIDAVGNGWLRLTEANNNEAGSAVFDTAIPTGRGLSIEFEYAMYGGSGADGLTFFMFDGATPTFTTGASGGSLGYAQKTIAAGAFADLPGVPNGYFGLGIDLWGNYSNPTEGRIGGTGFVPNAIAIRGPGNGLSGYGYMNGTGSLSPGITTDGRPAAGSPNYRKVFIDLVPIASGFRMRVRLQRGTAIDTIIPGFEIASPPPTLKFGVSGSTGGSTNIHELRLLRVTQPLDLGITKALVTLTDTTVTYSITATNAGPNADPAARITDPGAPGVIGLSWTCAGSNGGVCATAGASGPLDTTANLPVGGTVTYTMSGIVSSLALSPLVNTARVSASPSFADVNTTNDTATVAASLSSDLAITKTAPPTYTPGEAYTYQIDVLNNGVRAVFGARVTDVLPPGLVGEWFCEVVTPPAICHAGRTLRNLEDTVDLEPRAMVRYTLRLAIPPGQSGPLTNTVTVTPPAGFTDVDPANNTASVTSTAAPSADLYVSKSSTPNPYVVGDTLTYTMVVTNRGPSHVTDARVQDTVPTPLAGFRWTCTPSIGAACTTASGTGNINNVLVTLPVGASATFVLSGTLGSAVEQIQNTVTVTPPVGVADPVPGNNSVTDTNPTLPLADLLISKSGEPNPFVPGEAMSYTVTVSNRGPSDVTDARVQDELPPSIAASFTWICTAGTGGATCTTPSGSGSLNTHVSLPSGTEVTFTFTGIAPPAAAGILANTATVTPPLDVTDPSMGNNISTSQTPAPFVADLQITKESSPNPYDPGATLTTTIVVTNAGPDAVTGARVLDVPPAGLGPVTWTCTVTAGACGVESGTGQIDTLVTLPAGATATFVASALAPTTHDALLLNTATVTPPRNTFDPAPGNNEVTNINPTVPGADVIVTKIASPSPYVPGQPLTYTIEVANGGPIGTEGVRLRDALHPALASFTWTCVGVVGSGTCGRADGVGAIDVLVNLPAIGDRVRVVVTGTVGLDVSGDIRNEATVTLPGGAVDPDLTNNSVVVTTPGIPLPDLGIVKVAIPVSSFLPGSPLTYLIRVTNHGEVGVPAGGYAIADTLPHELLGAEWTCSVTPSGTCGVTGGELTTSAMPAVEPGQNVLVRLDTVVPADVLESAQNTATVSITAPGLVDRDLSNNTSTLWLFVSPLSAASIVGRVTDADGAPLAGVTINLSGTTELQTTTASDGTYAFPGLAPGHAYTVAPAPFFGYVFTPTSRNFPSLTGEVRADFVGVIEPYQRYYAEGSTGAFFTTTYSLTNPWPTPANVSFRFQLPVGPEITHALTLAPGQHVELDASTIPGLESTAFSAVINADRQIFSARTMDWDRSGYGTHRGTGVQAPRTAWFMAEGATIGRFSLFYLLQNPGDVPATVTIRYLIQALGTVPVVRTYLVAPHSRYTIGVHDDPALVHQELSAEITTDGAPIVVERAMYWSEPRLFEAGAAATASPAPAATWYFAEGATGTYFELFLLLANPGAVDVTASVHYLLPDGSVVSRVHEVPAGTRRTVWVDHEDPLLADTAVAMRVEASAPIVAERAMWWPGLLDTWAGGHASLGSTYTAPKWGISGLLAGGASNAQPWILVANPSTTPVTVRMTLLFDDGRPAVVADYPVGAQSRFTIDVAGWHPETADASFGAVIEQLGDPTGIIVESAVYRDSGGVAWAAGRGGTAAPIP